MRKVAFICMGPFKLLDISGPLQVFTETNKHTPDGEGYEVSFVSVAGGPVATDTGVMIETKAYTDPEFQRMGTSVFLGNSRSGSSPEELDMVKTVAANSERLVSICVAAFALARAGVLDGKRAVTHWENTADLEEDFDCIDVQHDPIYVHDGNVWTSGGVTSGIDLALALVKEDFDGKVALSIARSLVTYLVRPGDQKQFSQLLQDQTKDRNERFNDLPSWIAENVTRDLSVEALAEQCQMSKRSFARHFTTEFNQSPAQFVELVRLEVARTLMSDSRISMKEVASRSGFLSVERLRRSFKKNLGASPVEYRNRFNYL